MALKKKLTKAEYDKLSDVLKSEYIEDGDGYRLDVDGEEDTGALKRAKDREAQLRRDAEKRAKDLEDQLAAVTDGDARKKGDIETLEKSWSKKLGETEAQYKARIDKLTDYTRRTMVDGTAMAIASKISTVPALMAKAVRERLTVDFEGDEPALRILDTSGKPSALTVDELTKEFVANKDFSSIIIGSKASGGGAPKNGLGKSGGATTQTDNKPTMLSTLKPSDLAAELKARKERQE